MNIIKLMTIFTFVSADLISFNRNVNRLLKHRSHQDRKIDQRLALMSHLLKNGADSKIIKTAQQLIVGEGNEPSQNSRFAKRMKFFTKRMNTHLRPHH